MEYDICDMRFLNLNSSNSTLNNSSYLSDVRFNFKNVLSDENAIKYVTCGVLNAQIPVSFYTINYTNYLLNYSVEGGAINTLYITRGNYNSNSLITELLAQFATLGHTFTISTNKINGIMTFTYATHSFIFYGTSTIFSILGFVSGTNYTSSSFSIIAPYPLNLLGIKRLNINSQALSTNTYNSQGLSISSNIASVPVNVPSFGLIDYVNASNAFPMLNAHTVSYVDIQITDEDNNLINFNGINWTLTIQLNIFRKGSKDNKKIDFSEMTNLLTDIKDELANTDNTNNNQEVEQEDVQPDQSTNYVLPAVDDSNDDLEFLLYNHQI